jgi:hypothetical protein
MNDSRVTNTAPDTGTGSEAQGPTMSPVVPRHRRFRWAVAGSVVLVVTIATAAGAFVLSGASGPKSLTAAAAPANSVFFMELRTDLPGDQRANLADFMTHFPGFQDRNMFDSGLDELLNRLTSAISPDLSYTSAFKPWREGEVSFAMQLPDMPAVPGATCAAAKPGATFALPSPGAMTSLAADHSGVAIFSLKDRAKAAAWIGGEVSRLGLTSTTQGYAGATIYLVSKGGDQAAYALTDQDLLLGTVSGVKASLDTSTRGSLATNATYQAAMATVGGDSLARFYVDVKSVAANGPAAYEAMRCRLGLAGATMPAAAADASRLPAWVAGFVRAESSRMIVETNMPRPADAPISGNHVSRLASALPGNTVAAFEAHGVGAMLTTGLNAISSAAPSGVDTGSLKQVQQALSVIGGLDWIGDATAVVTKTGDTFGGGLVAEATDASTAKAKLGNITSLVALSGFATGIKSSNSTYKGSTITTVDIPAKLAGTALSVSVGVKDNLVFAGDTDAFVKAMLDTTPSNSLSAQPDYANALAAAGSSNAGAAYVNVPAVEAQIGQAVITKNSAEAWKLYYQPYFDHLGGIAAAVVDGSTVTIRLVVTAK